MVGVVGLGYLGVETPALEAWDEFAPFMGARIAQRDADRVLVGVDDWHHRLAVCRGDVDRVVYVGWEVADAPGLDALVERLIAAGFDVQVGSPDQCRDRHVQRLAIVEDPAGLTAELFVGPERGWHHTGDARFVTAGLGLGHVVLIVPDTERYLTFTSVLGFGVSDTLARAARPTATFLHCNARHHSLALLEVPGQRGLGHLMLELDDVDTVGRVYDAALERGWVFVTLGRHTNDWMTSFYLQTPSTFTIEYGAGGRTIEPAGWTPETYASASRWGHKLVGTPVIGAVEPVAVPT